VRGVLSIGLTEKEPPFLPSALLANCDRKYLMDTPERVLVGQNLLELTVFEAPTVRMLAEKLSPADQTTFSTLGRESDSGPASPMFSLMLRRRPRPPTGDFPPSI
jgi:hypothetical protein